MSFGCNNNGNNSTLAGAPGVGSVDLSVIVNLEPFQQAEKKFEEERQKLAMEYNELVKGLNDKQKESIQAQFQQKLAELQYSIVTPLQEKQKKAIEKVAKEEGLSVILDKTIVVCGVTDITDKVKKVFLGSDKEDKSPTPSPAEKTPARQLVGYLNQEKLYNIPKMKKAQEAYFKEFNEMQVKLEKTVKELYGDNSMPPAKILSDYQKKLDSKKAEIFKPVDDEINKAASDIAKEKNLIVVLDEINILYGGIDLTDEVVDKME